MLALAAFLLLLAVIQYRWLGQLSSAERERMQAHLNTAAARFSQDFNGELNHAYASFLAAPPARPMTPQDYASRFLEWRSGTAAQRIVRDFYVVDRGPGGELTLELLQETSGAFLRVEWPARLTGLRQRLLEKAQSEFAPGQLMNGIVDDGTLSLVAPRFGPAEAGAFPRISLSGWSVAELDAAFLETEYFPELARKHFGGQQALNCNLQVVSNTDRPKVIFELDTPRRGELLQHPDASAPLLDVRPNPFGRGPPGLRPPPLPGDPPGPLWQLLVKHRAGSLEASVEDVRRRNLLVSFAILLLMGASMAMLFVSTRRAQRLAELQMEFVAGVSHELRTPLTVICSAGENLADGVVASEERRRRYGSVIRDEGRRLSQMVEEILAFAGANSGSAAKNFQPVEISELVDRAVAACGPAFRDHGCEVERQIAADLPQVLGDATSLTHALRNLLSNAVKYGPQSGSIAVKAQGNGGKHPTVEIRIEDKGPGIDPADLPYIFEPFYRGARAKEDQIPGAGLGLSLVKRILEAHGGNVSAANAAGGGASFTLTLPAAPEPELEDGR